GEPPGGAGSGQPKRQLCAIGDPDQAIYGFRGGDVGHFLRFREDFPDTMEGELTRNYRSTPTIVAAALQAVAPSTLAPERTLAAVDATDDGPVVVHLARDEREEALFVADTIERMLGGSSFATLDRGGADSSLRPRLSFSDFAVLYRTGAEAEPVAEALARRGFPCRVRSHERLVDQPGVRAVLGAFREIVEADVERPVPELLEDAVRRAAAGGVRSFDAPSPDDLATAVELLAPLAVDCGADLRRFQSEVTLGAGVDAWDRRADLISLLTLHASKGLEFPVVFIVGCDDGLVPLRTGGETDEAEERRLLFVGMTRARYRLLLTSARSRTRWGRVQRGTPSPFLAAIDPTLVVNQTSHSRPRPTGGPTVVQPRLL
ncbi:MAG: ATP-dependent helicase, partial [Acidimicrobiales bacterium]|nr:ATP-dependent helicase [Acidimicrobiales bacterium]